MMRPCDFYMKDDRKKCNLIWLGKRFVAEYNGGKYYMYA